MSNTYKSEHICYTEPDNLAITTFFALKKATELLRRSFLFSNYPKLNTQKMLQELDLDAILIGSFFELTSKAYLLHSGHLIHIIKNERVPDDIKELAKKQEKFPVNVDGYLRYDSFKYDKKLDLHSLQYLDIKTLSYQQTYCKKYRDQLPFSDYFVSTALRYRPLRNTIHFPTMGASQAMREINSLELDLTYEVIVTELNKQIEPLTHELKRRYPHLNQL